MFAMLHSAVGSRSVSPKIACSAPGPTDVRLCDRFRAGNPPEWACDHVALLVIDRRVADQRKSVTSVGMRFKLLEPRAVPIRSAAEMRVGNPFPCIGSGQPLDAQAHIIGRHLTPVVGRIGSEPGARLNCEDRGLCDRGFGPIAQSGLDQG